MSKKIIMAILVAGYALNVNAATNEKPDLLRCEVSAYKDLGGGSSQTRPVTVLVADGKDPHAAIGFKYSGKKYIFAVGIDSLIATKGMPATTVAVVQENKLVTSLDSARLVAKMTNGSYNWDSEKSERIAMPSGESLFIDCSGQSERRQLINNSNAVEALYESTFGRTSN